MSTFWEENGHDWRGLWGGQNIASIGWCMITFSHVNKNVVKMAAVGDVHSHRGFIIVGCFRSCDMKKSQSNRDFGLGRGAVLDVHFSGAKGQTVNFRYWFLGFL